MVQKPHLKDSLGCNHAILDAEGVEQLGRGQAFPIGFQVREQAPVLLTLLVEMQTLCGFLLEGSLEQ